MGRENSPIAIIALGKNWQKTPHPSQPIDGTVVFASAATAHTAIAAGEKHLQLQSEGRESILVFSTGHTIGAPDENGINHYPTEGNIMYQQFRQVYSTDEIPESVIYFEDTSIDTAGNAEETGKMLRILSINEALIVTVAPHILRAERLFRTYNPDIRIETAVTEEILSTRGFAVNAYSEAEYAREKAFEGLLRFAMKYDPKGKIIPRKITQLSRK